MTSVSLSHGTDDAIVGLLRHCTISETSGTIMVKLPAINITTPQYPITTDDKRESLIEMCLRL
jgi:hypothetical protein